MLHVLFHDTDINRVVLQMRGGSGGQSPIIQSFDAAFGSSHEPGIYACVCLHIASLFNTLEGFKHFLPF